jgi:hypothetical protein
VSASNSFSYTFNYLVLVGKHEEMLLEGREGNKGDEIYELKFISTAVINSISLFCLVFVFNGESKEGVWYMIMR